MNKKFPFILVFILFFLSLWSFHNATNRQVWWTEMGSVILVFCLLLGTYKKFQFSNISYFIIFLWLILQIIGAHYTFEKVPFDFITNLFGFQRNHYDRLAHFIIGLSSFLVVELAWRNQWCSSIKISAIFGLFTIMAIANAWELVEWLYAEIDGGTAGAAFLGSQGDIWDAQKDMLFDTMGAILGCLFFVLNSKSHNK